jgi:hypothetical protein
MNQVDPFITPEGTKNSTGNTVYQIGLAEVANNVMDREMRFFDIDIVADGPLISVYVDGIEMVRDFYDVTWENPARRRGSISIGGAPLMRFGNIKVTLIEHSSLVTSSVNVSRANPQNVNIEANLNGNAIIFLRHEGRRLIVGTDYTINDNIVTLNSSFLQRLPAGRNEITVHFNLGVRQLPFTINVQ